MAKILIAEDERVQQLILIRAVESTGHIPVVASDGIAAWNLLNAYDDIKLLITDVSMPEMDGRELVSRLRKSDTYKDLPVVIVSGAVGIKDIEQLLVMGASRFLPKPVRISEIVDYIERLVVKD